jgi:hypothetical protein
MNPAAKTLLALFALINLWFGAAIIIAGVRAALEGSPDHIGSAGRLIGMA